MSPVDASMTVVWSPCAFESPDAGEYTSPDASNAAGHASGSSRTVPEATSWMNVLPDAREL